MNERQLACAPVDSPEGRRCLGAMRCAVNRAFANRQGQHPPHALIDILLTGVHSTITY